jgi:hypothetical protein
MMNKLVQRVLDRYTSLRGSRGALESHWRDIARMCWPEADEFFESRKNATEGEKRNQHLFDSTAQVALGRFASFMESIIVPRQTVWHSLRSEIDELNEDMEVRRWMDKLNRKLWTVRHVPRSGFQSNMHSVLMGLGAFGNGCLFIDENIGEGMRYKGMFLGDIYVDVNHQNIVDSGYRCFTLTARNVLQQWPESAPDRVRKDAEKNPGAMYDIVHGTYPNDDYDPRRVDSGAKKFRSVYILKDTQDLLEVGGYRTFPFAFARYIQTAHEMYGRGPGSQVLPSMLGLNEMKRTDLRMRHKMTDPPLLVNDDGVLGGQMTPDLRPGALNFGGVDSNGRQMIQPMQFGGRLDASIDGMQMEKNVINDAFFVSLFQILAEAKSNTTATEVLVKLQEKGQLVGPLAGRMESEFIGTMIERELDILEEQGELPPPPPQFIEAGGRYTVQFDSPVNRAARAEQLTGINQTLQLVTPIAQVDPTVYDIFDYEKIARIAADGYGAPPEVVRSVKEVAERARKREAAQQAQMQVEAMNGMADVMPKVAKSQLDMAKAQQLSRG